MRAQPDGFLLEFTRPIDPESATQLATYVMSSYTYLYHQKYGSPEVDAQPVSITEATVLEDDRSVRLRCTGLRAGYVHELVMKGLRARDGDTMPHPEAYYTLNRIPRE